MRSVLTAAAAVSLLVPLASASGTAGDRWSGTWKTNFGTMKLTQNGRTVEGTYTHDTGRLRGTVTGNILTGRWNEAPTRAGPTDAGYFRFRLSANGKSFTSRWRYARAGDPWKTNWVGKCRAGPCLKNAGTQGKPTRPPGAASGAFPGGTATKLTLTIGGVTATTDLATNVQTPPDPILKAKSSTTVSGSVSLDGTLPAGWTVAVFHNGASDIVLNSPTGGPFSVAAISPTFDAFTRPGAYVCSTKVPPLCSPAAQANISIDWATSPG